MASICFLDLDDTIHPTTDILNLDMDLDDLDESSYGDLDDKVCTLVTEIKKHAMVHIVSNAGTKWIKRCINLLPKFKKMEVPFTSAKDLYPDFKPTEWKPLTFKIICDSHGNIDKIITIGDSNEHLYACGMVGYKGITSTASIRFKQKPSLYELYVQLDLCSKLFSESINVKHGSKITNIFKSL